MQFTDIAAMPLDDFLKFAERATPGELEAFISHLSNDQLLIIIKHLNSEKDAHWRLKIRSAILGLNTNEKLETAASALSVDQVAELIDKTLQIEDKHHWKLSPILVGMRYDVFQQFLEHTSASELQLLQHEGVTEPVQHQLTALGHELSHQITVVAEEINKLDEEIEIISLDDLAREDVFELQHQFGVYHEFFERRFQLANKALAIAWNTNRLDLIETLNRIKDSCQKYNIYGIGLPRQEKGIASGLFSKLETKLFAVYGDPESLYDPEGLHDDEPVIEALVKFSIWYLRDYWELGLLSSVKTEEDLELDPATSKELERTNYREALFSEARENLKNLGLSTVADLKSAFIFSKKTLREFIQEKQSADI